MHPAMPWLARWSPPLHGAASHGVSSGSCILRPLSFLQHCLREANRPRALFSHDPVAYGVSPHPVDDDSRGWAQHHGCHDQDGGQDDQHNDPDVQDVLGDGRHGGIWAAHDFHPPPLCWGPGSSAARGLLGKKKRETQTIFQGSQQTTFPATTLNQHAGS